MGLCTSLRRRQDKKICCFCGIDMHSRFPAGLNRFQDTGNIIYPFSGYFGIVLLIIAGYRDYSSRKSDY